MGQPVMHFEVVGKDGAKLRSFYGDLFGWEFQDVGGPMDYATVDREQNLSPEGIGIGGGARSGLASHGVAPAVLSGAALGHDRVRDGSGWSQNALGHGHPRRPGIQYGCGVFPGGNGARSQTGRIHPRP